MSASHSTASARSDLDRVLRSQFFNARGPGFTILLLLIVAFLAVAACASWMPARRAARIDPMATLRAH